METDIRTAILVRKKGRFQNQWLIYQKGLKEDKEIKKWEEKANRGKDYGIFSHVKKVTYDKLGEPVVISQL